MSKWRPLTKEQFHAASAEERIDAFISLEAKALSLGLDLGAIYLGDTTYALIVRRIVEHEAIEGTKASCEELFKLWASGKE